MKYCQAPVFCLSNKKLLIHSIHIQYLYPQISCKFEMPKRTVTDILHNNRCNCEKEASVCLAFVSTIHSCFPKPVALRVPRGHMKQVIY